MVLEFSLVGIHSEERVLTFARVERKDTSTQTSTPVKSELFVWPPSQWALRGGGQNDQIARTKKAAD